jgi:hypothetical protein
MGDLFLLGGAKFMDKNQITLNLDDEQSFAKSVMPTKDASSESASQVSGQPQNNDPFKPVKQLANRLQSINNSIVGFNRTFERAENAALRKTIAHYIDSWDQHIQAWQEEAIKHRGRQPQVQGDVFGIEILNDSIEMSFYRVPIEVFNPWLFEELGKNKTQYTETIGLISYLLHGHTFTIEVWSTSPHTTLKLRVKTKIDQADIAIIGLLISQWRAYKKSHYLFSDLTVSSTEQRVDTKPSIDRATTFRKSKVSSSLTNEQNRIAKLYLDTYESEKAHGYVRNQEEWMRKHDIFGVRSTLARWVKRFKDLQQ